MTHDNSAEGGDDLPIHLRVAECSHFRPKCFVTLLNAIPASLLRKMRLLIS